MIFWKVLILNSKFVSINLTRFLFVGSYSLEQNRMAGWLWISHLNCLDFNSYSRPLWGLDWVNLFLGWWRPYGPYRCSQVIPDLGSVRIAGVSPDRSWTNWPIAGHPSRFYWRHGRFFPKTVGCDGSCWCGMGLVGKGLLLWFMAWFFFLNRIGSYGCCDMLAWANVPKTCWQELRKDRGLLTHHEKPAGHGVDCHFAELLAHIIRVREP